MEWTILSPLETLHKPCNMTGRSHLSQLGISQALDRNVGTLSMLDFLRAQNCF
jgi:hypothetical protein